MGYETTVFVGQPYEHTRTAKSVFVDCIAAIDLCKLSYDGAAYQVLSDARKSHDGTKYKLALAGAKDYKIERVDLYGDPVTLVSIADLLAAMREDAPRDNYRRLDAAIALLSAFADNPQWPNVHAFQYGH